MILKHVRLFHSSSLNERKTSRIIAQWVETFSIKMNNLTYPINALYDVQSFLKTRSHACMCQVVDSFHIRSILGGNGCPYLHTFYLACGVSLSCKRAVEQAASWTVNSLMVFYQNLDCHWFLLLFCFVLSNSIKAWISTLRLLLARFIYIYIYHKVICLWNHAA